MQKNRKIIYYKNYFIDFFNEQSEKVKEKFDYVLYLVTVAEKIPKKFFYKIIDYDNLFEIRIEHESNIYRIFCCFDEGNIVVLLNGFQKKTQKTPKNILDKAIRIKEEYFKQKMKEIR